jgi:hypothetical protein
VLVVYPQRQLRGGKVVVVVVGTEAILDQFTRRVRPRIRFVRNPLPFVFVDHRFSFPFAGVCA